ncbi:MAG: phenylalanine--tRNA ligase subunit beta [Hyphomicrobiaceae bacterium]
MKFTLSWLKDHLDTDATIDTLSTTLSAIGLEVEGIENPAEKLEAFTIAKIVSAQKHPDADRLQVCQVEIAPGKPILEIVCGAPNARAGLITIFAPIGTYVPGLDVTLEKRKVRGVVSNGMLCSPEELGLPGDSEGIMDIGSQHEGQIGKVYVDVFDLADPVFDVALTPNRPDCTGVRGIARDLAAAGLGKLKPAPIDKNVEGKADSTISIALNFKGDTASACPVFAGRYVSGVKNVSSPDWLANRLTAIGLRPINALVDVTNYISYDRGRPLHVYDADKLNGNIQARLGKKGESFVGLDGKTYDVEDDMCVIADDKNVLGFGGVLGGEDTGCTEATANVFIESAWFDPIRTAQTGRKTGLITDARYRFERGVDPASVVPGLDQATAMILDLVGGTPSKSVVAGKVPEPNNVITFDPKRVEKLTGVKLAVKDITKILDDLGFEISSKGEALKVKVPSWRPDVHGAADLVEEVVRITGLNKIPSTPLPRATGVARPVLTNLQKRTRFARRALAARGLVEAVTWSFVTGEEATLFGGGDPSLTLANPISSELSDMRPSLLPGLIGAVRQNKNRGFNDVALFEIGQGYDGLAANDQRLFASGVRIGTAKITGSGRHWQTPTNDVNLYDAKADALAVLASLGVNTGNLQINRSAPNWFHPGRSGTLQLGPKNVLAHFGELHPATLKALDLAGPAIAFEIDLAAIPAAKKKSRVRPPLTATDLLPVRRDFAFVLDKDVDASDVMRAAMSAEKSLIAGLQVFDIFEGGKLGEDGKKSLGLEVTLQPTKDTLTDKEIEAVADRIITTVKKKTGGEIRD